MVHKCNKQRGKKMTIICVGTSKGGVGKTTLASNLAALLIANDEDVILVDSDKQASASTWCAVRDENKDVKRIPCIQKFGVNLDKEIIELSKRFKHVIVDVGGFDSVELRATMLVTDKFIIPIKTGQFDLWTISAMTNLVRYARMVNSKLEAYILLNMVSTNPAISEFKDALKLLEEVEDVEILSEPIHERIAFRKAAQSGLSIFELEKPDKKAIEEFTTLYKRIMNNEPK